MIHWRRDEHGSDAPLAVHRSRLDLLIRGSSKSWDTIDQMTPSRWFLLEMAHYLTSIWLLDRDALESHERPSSAAKMEEAGGMAISGSGAGAVDCCGCEAG